jgi:hydrogenase nickel incorporation protein HypA/HybF
MHELAITREVLTIVSEYSAGRKVTRVVLEIGRLSTVLPDSVRLCFDACCAGTPAEGAELEIIETPGQVRCRECGAQMTVHGPFDPCGCGSHSLEWLAGDDLKVKELEVI